MEIPVAGYWILALFLVIITICLLGYIGRMYGQRAQMERARAKFQQQRTQLEDLFFKAASASGKPRGLRWQGCQWENPIEWVRDRHTGQVLALIGVTISFTAIEGSDMEGLAAVGNLRNATAVFFWQDGQWQTAGRAIFNLNPDEALQHFKGGYERIP